MSLNGSNKLGRSTCRFYKIGGVYRVILGIVVMLFPIQIVQKADNPPEFLVFRVELAREIAHGLLDGFAMLNMELIFVVRLQELKCRSARHARTHICHNASPLSNHERADILPRKAPASPTPPLRHPGNAGASQP